MNRSQLFALLLLAIPCTMMRASEESDTRNILKTSFKIRIQLEEDELKEKYKIISGTGADILSKQKRKLLECLISSIEGMIDSEEASIGGYCRGATAVSALLKNIQQIELNEENLEILRTSQEENNQEA